MMEIIQTFSNGVCSPSKWNGYATISCISWDMNVSERKIATLTTLRTIRNGCIVYVGF